MKKLRRAALASLALTLGTSALAVSPASADGTNGPLCRLNSNAYQYEGGVYERTVHAGHHFRVHGTWYDNSGRVWYYGHSGESWWDDGFVLSHHVSC